MKIKTFSLLRIDSDDEINAFVAEHEKNFEQNGVYVFSDRLVFMYDDGDVEDKIKNVLRRSIREELVETCGKQFNIELRAFEARRAAKSGTLKPDDVVRFEGEVNAGKAKIDYLTEKLDEMDNGDAFRGETHEA